MKHNVFYFLFLILVSLFYYAPNTTASPIINGLPDDTHRFKFHVSIQRMNPGNEYKHVCGGSIISERYILTAAHCFIMITNEVVEETFYPLGTTKIIAGTNHIDGPGIERDVITAFIPLEHNADSNHHPGLLTTRADVAVAELSADLGVHQHPERLAIMPLEALEPHSNAGVNKQAVVCGFGRAILVKQHDGKLYPAELFNTINRFINVKILGKDECIDFNTAICAINSDKRVFRTTCFGDSGGGLVYDNKLIGVLSIGPHNCNTLDPIVFTRLYEYMRFIEEAQNPRGDHSNMMILTEKLKKPVKGRRCPKRPRPDDGSSSSSAEGKRNSSQTKNYHARPV